MIFEGLVYPTKGLIHIAQSGISHGKSRGPEVLLPVYNV